MSLSLVNRCFVPRNDKFVFSFDVRHSKFSVRYYQRSFLLKYFTFMKSFPEAYKISKAPDGQGPLLTNYKPKL